MGSNGVEGAHMGSMVEGEGDTCIKWCQGGTHGIISRVKETRGSNGIKGAHMGSKVG